MIRHLSRVGFTSRKLVKPIKSFKVVQKPKAGVFKAFDPTCRAFFLNICTRYIYIHMLYVLYCLKEQKKKKRFLMFFRCIYVQAGEMNLCMNIVWILTEILLIPDFHWIANIGLTLKLHDVHEEMYFSGFNINPVWLCVQDNIFEDFMEHISTVLVQKINFVLW